MQSEITLVVIYWLNKNGVLIILYNLHILYVGIIKV